MSKTIVNKSQFNFGIKKIKERFYGEKGLRNLLEKGGEVELRKVMALVDRALEEENSARKYHIEEKLSNTVKEYLGLFDEIIPRPLMPQNLEFEIQEMVKEHTEAQVKKKNVKKAAIEQMSFLRIMLKSPKAWACAVWVVSLYFVLKKFFPH